MAFKHWPSKLCHMAFKHWPPKFVMWHLNIGHRSYATWHLNIGHQKNIWIFTIHTFNDILKKKTFFFIKIFINKHNWASHYDKLTQCQNINRFKFIKINYLRDNLLPKIGNPWSPNSVCWSGQSHSEHHACPHPSDPQWEECLHILSHCCVGCAITVPSMQGP